MKILYRLFVVFFVLSVFSGCNRNDNKKIFRSVDDFDDATIGVVVGTTQDKYAQTHFQKSNIIQFDQVPDLILALKSGKCDVILEDSVTFTVTYGKDKKMKMIDGSLYSENLGVGFSYDDPELRKDFNLFLAQLHSTGLYDKIKRRWIDSLKTATMPDLSGIVRTGKPIEVGCTGYVEPYDFILHGKNAGFDIEIIERFAAYLKRPVKYSIINFGGLISALSSGKVDVITASIAITPERAKQVAFSDPHFSSSAVAVVLTKNTPSGFSSMKDVANGKIAVLLGSAQDEYITQKYKSADIIRIPGNSDLVMSVISKQSDVGILSDMEATEIIKVYPSLSVLERGLNKSDVGVCFNKKDKILCSQFNDYLEQIRITGLLDSIINKWSENPGEQSIPELSFEKTGPPFKVGTTGMTIPFSFVKDKVLNGLDIELITRFAASLGRDVEFSLMNFESLIPSLSSGKIDVAINNIMYTSERAKQVLFSDPYYELLTTAIILSKNLEMRNSADNDVSVPFYIKIKESFINNLVVEKRYMLIVHGFYQTLLISVFSILLGTLLGAGICFLRMSRHKGLSIFAKVYIDLMRGTPVLVLLMIVFYVIFAKSGLSATVVAIFTFALNFAAYVSEMFRSAIEGIDSGQKEAGIALGFSNAGTFRYIILPQAVSRVLPVFKGEAISLVKMTSVVGYIAVQDLTKASDIIRSRTFDAFFPLIVITIIYFILAWLLGKGLDLLNRKRRA